MKILVLNCGSSSVKFAVVDPTDGSRPLEGIAERIGGTEPGRIKWHGAEGEGERPLGAGGHEVALRAITDLVEARPALHAALAGVGHRVVHGGERFTASVRIDAQVVQAVTDVAHLAPLHNPANLQGISAAMAEFPGLPQVAVFDTAFHQTMPERAFLYAVPRHLHRDHGVRRYGFHGTSHAYVVAEAARLLGRPLQDCAFISAHLGNGCSAAAVLGGRSVDTTMGLTPLEGLVMGTRSGDVDPGLHAFLAERLNTDVAGVTRLLNKQSGLLGLSELSNDMRTLCQAAEDGHAGAATAIDVFCYRLARQLAGLCVALGRLDAVIFTGGIGENAAPIRARVVELLGVVGMTLDPACNDNHGRDSGGRITAEEGPLALVVPTDEELVIASDTAALLGADQDPQKSVP